MFMVEQASKFAEGTLAPRQKEREAVSRHLSLFHTQLLATSGFLKKETNNM